MSVQFIKYKVRWETALSVRDFETVTGEFSNQLSVGGMKLSEVNHLPTGIYSLFLSQTLLDTILKISILLSHQIFHDDTLKQRDNLGGKGRWCRRVANRDPLWTSLLFSKKIYSRNHLSWLLYLINKFLFMNRSGKFVKDFGRGERLLAVLWMESSALSGRPLGFTWFYRDLCLSLPLTRLATLQFCKL